MAELETFLAGNVEALRRAQPGFAVPSGHGEPRRLEGEGDGSFALETPGGRRVQLHSRRGPQVEADRLVAPAFAGGEPEAVILIGSGLGYAIEAVGRRSAVTRVLAIEPFPACTRALLCRRDWREWADAGRLRLLVGPEYLGSADAWRVVDGATTPAVLVSPVIEREFPAEAAAARQLADAIVFGARANAEARAKLGGRYLLNTLRNLAVIAGEGDVASLFGAFEGVPAVLVAAGPSLDDSLPALKLARERALIVAVDTAARPLLAEGIAPDIVVAVDPTELNGRHLVGLPEAPASWLVAEPSVDPAAFPPFAGRTFTFSVADHHPWPWLRAQGMNRGRLQAWGSVLTSALDLALQMGADPIAFVGADLAYTARRPYCRGTMFEDGWAARVARGEDLEEIWADAIRRRALSEATDALGQAVQTTPHLVSFRDWILAETRRHPARRFVNATGRGILHGGAIEQAGVEDLPRVLPAGAPPDRGRLAQRHPGGAACADARSSAAILEKLEQAGPDPATLAAWQRIAAPQDCSAVLSAALRHPGITDVDAPAGSVNPGWGIHRPERVAILRDLARGGQAARGLSGVRSPYTSRRDAAARAWGLLAELLEMPSLLEAGCAAAQGVPSDVQRGLVPSALLPWNETARPLVSRLEDACCGRQCWPHETDDADRAPAQLHACLPAGDRTLDHDASDLGARLALLWEWLTAADTAGGNSDVARWLECQWRLLTDAQPASGRTGATSFVTRLQVASADGVPTALRATGVVGPADRRIAGAAVRRDGDGACRLGVCFSEREAAVCGAPLTVEAVAAGGSLPAPWLSPSARWLEWRDLCREGLPGALVASTFDDRSALVSAAGGTRSYRVFADGRFECVSEWPRAISGEVRLAGGAGHVAWHYDPEPYLMYRPGHDGRLEIAPLPFHASLAHPQPDGTVLWTAYSGGLWRWHPPDRWSLLVETPPIIGLHREADGFRLDRADLGRAAAEAFLWTPGRDRLGTRPLGPEAQAWSSARRADWLAFAHPHAGIVRMRRDDGRTVDVTCPSPFNVAWAGDSLVATSGPGEPGVFLFRELASKLEALGGV